MKYPLAESSILEFKKELPQKDQIVKTIVGFCNQKGGKLIIGVENDGTICGIPAQEVTSTLEYLDQYIFTQTCPPIRPLIYSQNIGDKIILIIEVSPGMSKPYYVTSLGLKKGSFIRLGRSTLLANADIIQELQWQARGKRFDMSLVYEATVDDLDSKEITYFLKTKKQAAEKITLEDALPAYNLTASEHGHTYPTVAGILHFGKNPQRYFPEAVINCAHYKGIAGRDIIAYKRCEGTILSQLDNALEFIYKQLNVSFTFEGIKRIETLEIPRDALRELIINALIHRNYQIQGSIKVSIFENRVEILSPGDFPGPLTENNLLMGLTYIRNEAIAKVFMELGLSERLGTGFRIVFENMEQAGLPQPQIIEGENFIKCILERPTTRQLLKKEPVLTSDGNKILKLFQTADALSVSEIVQATKMPRATVGRRLNEMIKENILTKTGSGKGTRYSLK